MKPSSTFEIDCFFAGVACVDLATYRDKTEIVKSIINKHRNQNIIVVGDSEEDYLSAVNNNCDFLYCSYGYGNSFIGNQDFVCVNNAKELFSIISN